MPFEFGRSPAHGLPRDGLTSMRAGKILDRVMTGFFTQPAPQDPEAVSALADDVSGLFRGIIAVQREQLERAY